MASAAVRTVWAGQLESFAAAGHRAVAWDAPGYGESATIDPYDMAGLAHALEHLLDAIGAERVVLLGHSMGGMIAQAAAAAFPQRIAGLILSATSPAFGKPDGAWQQAFLRQRLAPLDAGKTMADLAPALVAGWSRPDAEPAGVRLATDVMARVPSDTYRRRSLRSSASTCARRSRRSRCRCSRWPASTTRPLPPR